LHDIVGIHSDVEIVDNKPLNLVNYFSMNRQRKTERSQSCKEKLMKFHRVLNFHSTKDGLLNCITKVYDNSILMDFIKCLVTNISVLKPLYIDSISYYTIFDKNICTYLYRGLSATTIMQALSCKHYYATDGGQPTVIHITSRIKPVFH
jgi:uncharacterized protein YkvS